MNDRHPSGDRPSWVEQATGLLDDSARDLDAATLSRLNRARQAALELRRPRRAHPWLLPAGLAGACALLLAVAVWQPRYRAAPAQMPATAATADAGDDEASLEFYQDLEFYAWLDAQNQGDDD
jgi:hypothetical protein